MRCGMPNRPRTRTGVSTIPGTASPAITGMGPASFKTSTMRFSSKGDDAVTITKPKIHASVFARIMHGAHSYAPIGLPEHYAVVTDKGEILDRAHNPDETAAQAKARAEVQEHVRNLVWRRRLVYLRPCSPPSASPPSPCSTRRNQNSPADSVFCRPSSASLARSYRALPVGGSMPLLPIRAGLSSTPPSLVC